MIIEAVYDDVEFTDSDRALIIKKDREKGYVTTEGCWIGDYAVS